MADKTDVGDWRGDLLERLRTLIMAVDPEIVEEVKWRKPSNPDGVPVWSRNGMICTGETYRDKVKLTFANGAALDDQEKLFNSSLDGGTRRAIDFHEGDAVDGEAIKTLVRGAIAHNASKAKR